MKTIIISFLLMLCASTAKSQDYGLYWKYKDYDGISLTIPSVAIDIGTWFVDEKTDRMLMRKVDKVRVMVFEDYSPITERDLKKFDRRAKRRHLDDMIYVREGKTRVRIMVKERRNIIRKVVVFVNSPEAFVMVSVKGHLRLDDINRVLEKYGKEKKKDGEPIVPPNIKIPVYRT